MSDDLGSKLIFNIGTKKLNGNAMYTYMSWKLVGFSEVIKWWVRLFT